MNNGGCSSLCLATPGSRQCACAEDQVLDTDGVTCLGMRGPARVGGREADPYKVQTEMEEAKRALWGQQ